jgi:peptidoglycan/xylan/chitin deacetylase (PgdA/CDA1 family)
VKYGRIKGIGRILRGLQVHRLNSVFSPKEFIRVTYTHQVLKEDEGNFESLIAFLVKTNGTITPSKFFKTLRREEPLAGKNVLVTFDDGLISSYRAIKNILSKYDVKAILFVPTQILELKTSEDMKRFAWQNLNFKEGQASKTFREEEYLTMGKKEILDLQKEGRAVFPHTHTHKRLIDIKDEQTALEEIVKPKKILQELLQSPMDAFAFPVGTERVVSDFCFPYLKHEYRYCFSALAGKNTLETLPYFLHRDCMNADYDLEHVRNMQEGVFDAYYQYKISRLKAKFGNHEQQS